jgi:hypothetical protein
MIFRNRFRSLRHNASSWTKRRVRATISDNRLIGSAQNPECSFELPRCRFPNSIATPQRLHRLLADTGRRR